MPLVLPECPVYIYHDDSPPLITYWCLVSVVIVDPSSVCL